MKHSDVEALWSKAWQMPGSAQTNFAALVLEKAADQFELQPHVEMFRPSVAEELRAMSAALQSGDRG